MFERYYMPMIKKSELVGKYVTYIDNDCKIRTERVAKVSGSYVTVVNALKIRHRVHKDRIRGRQFPKKGMEGIDWGRGK